MVKGIPFWKGPAWDPSFKAGRCLSAFLTEHRYAPDALADRSGRSKREDPQVVQFPAIILGTGLCAAKVGNRLLVRLSRHSGGHNYRGGQECEQRIIDLKSRHLLSCERQFSRARSLVAWLAQGRATASILDMPFLLALKAEALHLADRTSEALETIRKAEALAETKGEHWWSAELRRLRGVFLTALGAEETQIEA